jgi:hypothetical protein
VPRAASPEAALESSRPDDFYKKSLIPKAYLDRRLVKALFSTEIINPSSEGSGGILVEAAGVEPYL